MNTRLALTLKILVTGLCLITFCGCPSAWQFRKDRPKPRVSRTTLGVFLPKGIWANLGAEYWSPSRSVRTVSPKTVVIFVPGSGSVSRKGTRGGDGAVHYKKAVDVNLHWAEALANDGYYSLIYDKRNCGVHNDDLCVDNPIYDLNQEGPAALARDVDAACDLARTKVGADGRIVLWTNEQGTQVVLASKCKDKAAALVFAAPIPYRVDQFWVEGLQYASEQPKNADINGSLVQKSLNMQAIFDSIADGLFTPGSKLMGATLQFWREWIKLTAKTEKLFKKTHKPVLFILGEEDSLYNERAMEEMEKLSENDNRRLLTVAGADHNLLSGNILTEENSDIVLGALARLLNDD